MKKSFVLHSVIIVMVIGLHAFRIIQGTTITGKLSQMEEVKEIWAFNGQDTVRTTVKDGYFVITAKSGDWKVFIDAKPPFRDVIFEKVAVKENQSTHLGKIRLY